MIKLIFIPLFVFLTTCCYSQRLPLFLSQDTINNYNGTPLMIISVNGKPPVKIPGAELNKFSTSQIEGINLLKNDSAGIKYGPEALNGVIIIRLKKGSTFKLKKMTSTVRLLDIYHIKRKFKGLPLFVDSNMIVHPQLQYFHLVNIKSVKIDTELVSGIPFINILTKNPMPRAKPGIIYIH